MAERGREARTLAADRGVLTKTAYSAAIFVRPGTRGNFSSGRPGALDPAITPCRNLTTAAQVE